jgi:hypothetical protein
MTHHGVMTTQQPGTAGRDWVAGLPAELAGQRAILTRLIDFCAAEPRARWLVIGCSLARAAADRLSDLDLAIGIETGTGAGNSDDEGSDAGDFDAACADIRRAVDGLGDLVESFQHRLPEVPGPHIRIFAQYADRCQVDLVVFPASVSAGSVPNVVVLYDPAGLVTIEAKPRPVTPEQVREWAFLSWCALADLGKYLRRGSWWEARGRLDEARAELWKLQAAAGRVPDAQYGLTSILDFAPAALPPEMTATVAGLDPAALLAAARHLARLLGEIGENPGGLDAAQRAALPGAMARFIRADLDAVRVAPDMRAPARA